MSVDLADPIAVVLVMQMLATRDRDLEDARSRNEVTALASEIAAHDIVGRPAKLAF